MATDVLVTMAPSLIELDRVGPVFKAIEEAAGYHDDDPAASVLLNRVVANASSTALHRSQLESDGRHVLTATVPRREAYTQAFGGPIPGHDGPHGAVADELLAMWGQR